MSWSPRNFFHSSLGHLIPAGLLARWNKDDQPASTEIAEDALVYDPATGRYKLKQEVFDRLLSDAMRTVLLDKTHQS